MGNINTFTRFTGVTGSNMGTHTVTAAEATANTVSIQTDFRDFTKVIVQVRDSDGDEKTSGARITFSGSAGTVTVADQGTFALAEDDVITYLIMDDLQF